MTQILETQLQEILTPYIPITRVSQGAEAVVYRTNVHPYLGQLLISDPSRLNTSQNDISSTRNKAGNARKINTYIIKYRPPKTYRHPTLDSQLTKHRTLAEARLLQRLGYAGVNVPDVIHVDFRNGVIWMEDIVGDHHSKNSTSPSIEKQDENNAPTDTKDEMRGSLKNWIWEYEAVNGEESVSKRAIDNSQPFEVELLVKRVGQEIGKLHMNDIVHGDLTTSNILLRPSSEANANGVLEPVLIDFGLGSNSSLAEDKAVDLYVLERAVASTHPVNSELYSKWLLDGYSDYCTKAKQSRGSAKLKDVINRLQDVRLRGRKRSMVG